MAFEKRPIIYSETLAGESPTFEDLLDTACDRLWERHIQFSIQRIGELDQELDRLGREIDNFMSAYHE